MTKVLWFTGLSGSGKTTLAELLKKELDRRGKSYQIFDGDDVRRNLHRHLGFTPEDIKENNKLIANLCAESLGKVDYVIVPIISPFRESREEARRTIGDSFVEVYLNCPYDECKRRDAKGLYAKAESGSLDNFIGLHVPYEAPTNPDVEIESTKSSPKESLERIIKFLGI